MKIKVKIKTKNTYRGAPIPPTRKGKGTYEYKRRKEELKYSY